ncbi:MAG TPA: metalloregulator ArsR/SmtB family transcription factor [Gaiellaceae bacterium]|nr:metalloregulator ArsR/SmtB family transcription factor [Gaiellaceae bacterium]
MEIPTPISCCAPLAAPVLSDEEAEGTAALFRVLGDPARVRIVNVLATAEKPVCVCELTPALGLTQPTVSHHLKKLANAGLLDRVQRGRWAYYALSDGALERVRSLLDPLEVPA